MRYPRWLTFLAALVAVAAHAAPAPFDLAGPALQIRVTRGALTLPVGQVPNLLAGDELWIKADLPATQSVHYLLVAAFLSGPTNPPPKQWFKRCETWKAPCARDGFKLTVPAGAQQALLFLAPQTGGDFKTLVNTVRGRPGAFVRASQDLNQAALDRARLDVYLSAIRRAASNDPAALKQTAPLLARSLGVRLDEKCLDRPVDQQGSCLMQGQDSLILDDGHSVSVVEALTGGAAADLAMEASFTPQLGYGYYSPYVASVLDIARIFDSFRTARYQYIPALGAAQGERLSLTLNAAPSFQDPLSVLVTGLPAVQSASLPPLRMPEAKTVYCAARPALLLPAEGAPLVFANGFAHDLRLAVTDAGGKLHEAPVHADAAAGGFVVDTAELRGVDLEGEARASLRGMWGFDRYEGPVYALVDARERHWEVAPGDEASLIVGRAGSVRLRADNVACVQAVQMQQPGGRQRPLQWKPTKKGEIEVQLPLQDAAPGTLGLQILQPGAEPQTLTLRAFADAGHIDRLRVHAGDNAGVLLGSRLDKVVRVAIGNAALVPGKLSTQHGTDALSLSGIDTAGIGKEAGSSAQVTLQDGRSFNVPVQVDPPRPRMTLIGKSVRPSAASLDSHVLLTNPDQLPQGSQLVFSVRAEGGASLQRDAIIEIAADVDEPPLAAMSIADGTLTLENRQVAVATLDSAKALGTSVFGPLQFRLNAAGIYSDWQPLATLVRLPSLRDLKCAAEGEMPCLLSGSNLFLLDAVSASPQFAETVQVPPGFLGASLAVPRPSSGRLFVRLRDDPDSVNPLSLAPQELPPATSETAASPPPAAN